MTSPLDNIPQVLKDLPHWVTWNLVDGKKIPKPNVNESRLLNFEMAYTKTPITKNGGIGFVFTEGNDIGGIDLDASRNPETGELTKWAKSIVDGFDSYTEISPSGTGVKIWAKGAPPDISPNVLAMPGEKIKGKSPQVEVYVKGRYFAVTGEPYFKEPKGINERSNAWLKMVQFLKDNQPSQPTTKTTGNRNNHLTSLAGTMRRRGMDFDSIFLALQAETKKIHNPPLPDKEIRQIVKSVCKYTPTQDKDTFSSKDGNAIARAFATETEGLQHWRSDFYLWDGSFWKNISDEDMAAKIGLWLESKKVLDRKGSAVPFCPTAHDVKEVAAALARLFHILDGQEAPFWLEPEESDLNPNGLLLFKNGILNLNTKQLTPPDKRFFSLSRIDCQFDPTAKAPVWEKFVQEIFENDPESIKCLEEIFGYSLTADTSLQKAFLFQGEKRSGKGTLARVLKTLVGSDRYSGPTVTAFSNEFGLQQLIGKSVAVISDARGQSKYDPHVIVERILSITGEDSIGVNRKHKSHWEGRLPTRIFYLTNVPPKLMDPSGVVTSRFIALAFKKSFFGKEDPTLEQKLFSELSGIANHALNGLWRLRTRGYFEQPESGKELLEMLEGNTGQVRNFVTECCVIGPEYEIDKQLLFETVYSQWAKDNHHPPLADNTFSSDLYALGKGIKNGRRYDKEKKKQVYTYQGITLIDVAEMEKELAKVPVEVREKYGT